MANSVYRVTEIVGTSTRSWEDAAKAAVQTASKSLRDLRVAEIGALDMTVENGKVKLYRARVKLSFKFEAEVGGDRALAPKAQAAAAKPASKKKGNEAASMFSLIRNIGSSIGISLVVTVLGREAQIAHAELGGVLTPFRDALRAPWLPHAWDWTTSAGVAALNAEVSRQALMIAYVNDFRFMMMFTLLAAPLLRCCAPRGSRPG